MVVILLVLVLGAAVLAVCGLIWKQMMIWRLWKRHFYANEIHNQEDITKEYLRKVENHYQPAVEDDLDLLQVFHQLNTTRCEIGREYMYARMYMPPTHHQDLERMIDKIKDEKRFRKILYEFYQLGKGYSEALDLFEHFDSFHKKDYVILILLYVMLVLIILSGIFIQPDYFIGLFLWLVADSALYSHYHSKSYASLPKAISYCYVVEAMEKFERLGLFDEDEDIHQMIQKGLKYTVFYRTVSKLTAFDVLSIMEMIKAVFMIPVIQYIILSSHQKELEKDFIRMYEWIGLIDMAITVADLRQNRETCIPETGTEIKIDFHNCYHPLIKNAVKNSLTTSSSCMITGCNASGKSTFIKTIGINLTMAKAFHTCFADKFYYVDLPVCTSIHIKDDLESGESYYVREIKIMKTILDQVWQQPCFVFIDEILRGTNEKERVEISRVIVDELFHSDSLVFVTTHDLALVDYFLDMPQYCFVDEIKDHQLYCDYKIREGISKIGNAVKLLRVYNYDDRILNKIKI